MVKEKEIVTPMMIALVTLYVAAHVTALTIVRLNSSILEAFGLNQPIVVRNQVNMHSMFCRGL